ncbi:MAG: helix-turn-helix domain-containing protein [Lachnospiraceae bacterium]|nr:helix-turn-helix domain-containing protein [Lachnospiraceae bacterium]
MRLSLQIISEKLNMNTVIPLPEDADERLRLPRPVFYTGEQLLKKDTLYLAKGSDMEGTLDFEPGCGLICIGYPEKTISRRRLADVIILDEKINILKLANAVNAIYDFYDNWESQLLQTVTQPLSIALGVIMELSASVIGRKIALNEAANTFFFAEPKGATPGAEALLSYLNLFTERYINFSSERTSIDNPELGRLLTLALETGSVYKPLLNAELNKLSWNANDRYMLIALRPDAQDSFAVAAGTFCSEFTLAYPASFSFMYQRYVLTLVNLSAGHEEDMKDALKALTAALSFRGGCSNEFHDIYSIPIYFKEAVMAYNEGSSGSSDNRVYYFLDYSFDYIISCAKSELPIDELYSPVYYRLKKYDEENSSDYLDTLKAYLISGGNALQTAKDMFIHRATIIYRLKRICEIGETDLKDQKTLMHLYLTFAMLENSEKDNN